MGPIDPRTEALRNRLRIATDKLAVRIQKLKDAVASGGMTPETEAAFAQIIAELEAMGVDPNDPVPA